MERTPLPGCHAWPLSPGVPLAGGAGGHGAANVAGGAIAVPQLAQKRWPGPASAPHEGQCTGWGPRGWPQLAQKRAPAALSVPQPAQRPAGGGRAVPQDEQNLVPTAWAALQFGQATVAAGPW